MIYSGDLRDSITFYKIVNEQTASGFKKDTEVRMFTVRAQRLKNKESLVVDANEIFHSTRLTFRLRFRKEIDETNVVEFEGNRYRITSLDVFRKDNEMVIIIDKINE